MTSLSEIINLANGARFYRADLHIHCFGASHDVSDPNMTPDEVVKTALAEKLAVIAVTDHNEIKMVEGAVKAAAGTCSWWFQRSNCRPRRVTSSAIYLRSRRCRSSL